jgi:copper homeostasis protein
LAILLEVCVDDPAGLAAAVAGGADRIEICTALGLGGLTPSHGFMQTAAGCGVPCMAMIRQRAGDFVFAAAEVAVMRADIRAARAAGLAGVVIGALDLDGQLDADTLALLLAEAAGMDVTLHRAIDLCADPVAAVGVAMRLGFRRILTSGGAITAADGAATLAAMMARAGRDCIIMPGSGITAATVTRLAHLPLREIHASCANAVPVGGRALDLGFQSSGARRTDRAQVTALKAALAH